MSYVADRVKETTTTTGTGNITLLGPVTQFVAFQTRFSVGASNQFYYAIVGQSGTDWEIGLGHLFSTTILVRDSVFASSNADALVPLAAGTKDVFVAYPSTAMLNRVANEVPSGAVDGVNKIFTLAHTPASGTLKLYNGLRQVIGIDFTLVGLTITFVVAPIIGASIIADYEW